MTQEKPIRVMQIIARMNVGGPAVIVTDLMQGLDSDRFEHILITGYCEKDEIDYLDELAIDIPVTRIQGLGRSISVLSDIKSFYSLLGIIRRFKPDIIHTHTAKAGVLGRIASLIAHPQSKRIHTFHGHLLNGYFGTFKTRIVIATERLLATKSTVLIAVGNQVKEDLLRAKIGKENQYVVSFPGLRDLDIQSKMSARSELGLDQDKYYLVFIGRLTHIKRPDRLIEIARHLKASHNSTEIVVAGSGEKFEELQIISIDENLPITYLGWRNDIGRILSASDISILCSDNEGIPLTLIQASQAGLPIISTNVGSVSDIVVSGETGILTELNSNSLIKAVESMLSDHEKMLKYGQAGKKRAKELFSLQSMITMHENLYSQEITRLN